MLYFLDVCTIATMVLCLVFPIKTNPAAGLICRLMIFAVPLLFGLYGCGWIKRRRAEEKRNHLLTLPPKTITGTMGIVLPHDTGDIHATTTATGYSHQPGTLRTFVHYEYGTAPVYEGYDVTITPASGARDRIKVQTLPKKFWGRGDTIPSISGKVIVHYVTDTDGINYFLSVEQS